MLRLAGLLLKKFVSFKVTMTEKPSLQASSYVHVLLYLFGTLFI